MSDTTLERIIKSSFTVITLSTSIPSKTGPQIQLVDDEVSQSLGDSDHKLRVLDVGCGDGSVAV